MNEARADANARTIEIIWAMDKIGYTVLEIQPEMDKNQSPAPTGSIFLKISSKADA